MAFDKYSELDPAKMLRDIKEAYPDVVFDQFSVLDPMRARRQIETALGIQIDPSTMLDPARFQDVVEDAIEDADEGGGDAPEWVPTGAIAHIDPVNEQYWDGTSETTLAAMIDGATRDEDGLIAASGGFEALGAFFEALALPCTVVVAANDLPIAALQYETADPLTYVYVGMHNANATTDDFDSAYLEVTGVDQNANSKIAVTLSTSKIAASIEGAAVVMDDSQTLTLPAFTAIKVAAFDDTGRITQITVYAQKSDAALPALSEVA